MMEGTPAFVREQVYKSDVGWKLGNRYSKWMMQRSKSDVFSSAHNHNNERYEVKKSYESSFENGYQKWFGLPHLVTV